MTNWEKYYGSPERVANELYGEDGSSVYTNFLPWMQSHSNKNVSSKSAFIEWLQEEAS